MKMEDEALEVIPDRIPCHICNRKFVPESLIKHSKVCEKMLRKKRKTFDSAEQRVRGTELAEFLPVVSKRENVPTLLKTNVTPLLISSDKVDRITSPISKSTNYEKCPHCDRSFGPKAFDRHIEWCKEQSIRINLKSNATKEAKERLEARIRYRAPSIKSKRSITREKYSPKMNAENVHNSSNNIYEVVRSEDEVMNKLLEVEPEVKNTEKSKPKGNREINFIRQNVLRCSYKGKLSKKSENELQKDNLNNNFSNKKTEYDIIRDWISANGTKIRPLPQSFRITSSNLNKPLTNMSNDNYNPYISAEHQMKELLNATSLNVEQQSLHQTYTVENNKENISSFNHCGPVKTISCQTDGPDKSEEYFKTSPTSAFSKYSNANIEVDRTPTPIPTSDFDRNDDVAYLPALTTKYEPSLQPGHDTNMNRYPLICLSNLSLCSSVSIDVADDKSCRSADKIRSNKDLQLAERSVSACNIDKGCRNSLKKNFKMEHLLYGNKERKEADSNSTFPGDVYCSVYDEKLEKLNKLLDGENFDLLKSFTEFENVLRNTCFDETFGANSNLSYDKRNLKLERDKSMSSKINTDSAYNSLNRKSPALSESDKYFGKTSTPETDALKSSTSTFLLASDFHETNLQKLSKFCHECGARYPLDIAKFCCECGVRRLAL